MKTNFACPACAASGSVDDSLVGRQVRCKHCGHRFVIPGPSEPADDAYLLEEQARGTTGSRDDGGVFVPSRGDEPTVTLSPRKPKPIRPASKAKASRDEESRFALRTWLIRLVVLASVVLAAIALFAPRGLVIAGSVLIILGTLMVLVGYAAGAYGAFCEDFLYGFGYLVFPLYTAYYLVTRWEDLWKWLVGSTVGVGLSLLGIEMLRWAGVGE